MASPERFAVSVPRNTRPLFGEGSTLATLLRKAEVVTPSASNLKPGYGNTIPWPFDVSAVKRLVVQNEHHATCIATKASATVGLGFKDKNEDENKQAERQSTTPPSNGTMPPKMSMDILAAGGGLQEAIQDVLQKPSKESKILDPLCEVSFDSELYPAAEDFSNVANGFLEVIRDEASERITGIHFLPAEFMAMMRTETGKRFWRVCPTDGGTLKYFASFGERKNLIQELGLQGEAAKGVSEVIHFAKRSSLSRWYGFPDWLSAVASIELAQMLTQDSFDFHSNRGVPEFMVFITGGRINDKEIKALEEAMQSTIGSGNAHKSMALNFENPNLQVQVEKLGLEGAVGDGFSDKAEALALKMVTAHRVPPLLAGILIPGKMGSTNELPNALMAFHSLVVARDQRTFSSVLRRTLGSAGIGLTTEDFRFRTILDVIDIDKTDTMSRMRQTLPEAQAEGRDLAAGLKKAVSPDELREALTVALVRVLGGS